VPVFIGPMCKKSVGVTMSVTSSQTIRPPAFCPTGRDVGRLSRLRENRPVSDPDGRIYLHVGCRKTGTSFLQRVMYSDPAAVRAKGLALPLTGRTPHLRLLQALGVVTDAALSPQDADSFLRRFDRRLSHVAGQPALISHEDLATADREKVRRLLELLGDREVHVIITARDLARQIPSEWQQCVKTRMQTTYDDFVDTVAQRRGPDAALFWARQDVADVAARWGESLPPQQVHIVTVPPPGTSQTVLLERFWTVMGVDPSGFDLGEGFNPALGAQQAELLRRVNVALGDRLAAVREEYRPVVRLFVGQVLGPQQGKELRLPSHHAQWCRDVSNEIVGRLRSRGYDVSGDLGDLVPQETAAPGSEPGGGLAVAEADVSAAAVDALATLLARGALQPKPEAVAESSAGKDSPWDA